VTSRRFLINCCLMAEPDQPKKETVRIELPLPPATNSSEPSVEQRENVRIQLPVRETGGPSLSSSPPSKPQDIFSTNVFPPPGPPPASTRLSGSVRPAPTSPPAGPKSDTVRILLSPEPLRSSHKKTQPLIAMPEAAPQNPPISMVAEKSSMLLYWVLLGFAALILIIQIWTYFS
jgi:hypothetical protein